MSVFELDILNGEAAGRHRGSAVAERRLMAAILEDAIECFQKNLQASTGKRRRMFLEAERWIFSNDVCWVFSCQNICAVLGLDHGALRARARAWRRRHLEHADRPQPAGLAG